MPDPTLADRWAEVVACMARLRASLADIAASVAELRARVTVATGRAGDEAEAEPERDDTTSEEQP